MRRLSLDPAGESLLEPVSDVLRGAVERLPDGPPLRIAVGDVPGFDRLDGDTLILSSALAGPGLSHPDEPLVLGLDRWRRALACVLEGAARAAIRGAVGDHVEDWRTIGLAAHLADRAVPEAGLSVPDLALAMGTGDLGRHPRAGVAAFRAVAARGEDPWDVGIGWLRDGGPDPDAFLALGVWALGQDGVVAEIAAPVDRVAAADVPMVLSAWSWRPVAVPAHPRGGVVATSGDARIALAWAEADRPLRTLAAAGAGGGRLDPGIGFPTGAWDVASARVTGQVLGARGVAFECDPSGAMRIVLADAFVGPVAALRMAETVGTSGVVTGRWKVAGRGAIRFAKIANPGLTTHGRQRGAFRVPTPGGEGMGEWLGALEDSKWTWEQPEPDRLVLRGHMLGADVEMHWRRGQAV